MGFIKFIEIQMRNGIPTGLQTPKYREEPLIVSTEMHSKLDAIDILKVTTHKGEFDGNERSSARMINASRQLTKKDVKSPSTAPHSCNWVMANNSKISVTSEHLEEVLDEIAIAMDSIVNG